jgi:hypothetical protein
VQVAFESKVLKPGNHLIGARLKPGAFKLWVNWIQLALPHRAVHSVNGSLRLLFRLVLDQSVSRDVERYKLRICKKQTLKPGNRISGSRVETGCFQAVGQLKANFEASFSIDRFKV